VDLRATDLSTAIARPLATAEAHSSDEKPGGILPGSLLSTRLLPRSIGPRSDYGTGPATGSVAPRARFALYGQLT
jgi:hypothetical protein